MAANAGIIQAELSVQIGTALAQLREASSALAKFGQSAGAGVAPANEAIGGLTKSMKDFRKEQVQEGRLVGFYVKEVGDFIGLSKEAGDTLGNLGQTLLAAATNGISFGLAFEGAKLAIGVISNALTAAKKEAEATAAAIAEIQKRIDAIGKSKRQVMLEDINKLSSLLRAVEDAKNLPGRIGSEGEDVESVELEVARAALAKYAAERKLSVAALAQYEAKLWEEYRAEESAAQNKADIEQATRQEEGRRAQVDLAIKASKQVADHDISQAKRVADEAKKIREADAVSRGLTDALTYSEFAPGTDLKKPASQVAREAERLAAEAKARSEKSWGPTFGPGNNAGEMEFVKKAKADAEAVEAAWQGAGMGVAGAFSAIGNAVGGTGGKMLAILGQMLASAISVAIAYAAMAPPPWGAISMAAMAVGLLATIASAAATPAPEGRASGGLVFSGRYLVGERGPELLNLGTGVSGSVVPNHALALAGAGGGGGSAQLAPISLTFNAPIDRLWWRQNERHIVRTLREATRAGRA